MPYLVLSFCYYYPMASQYLQTALSAVKQAEEVILHYLGQNVRVQLKADESPVTIADQHAEEIIKKTIASVFPDHTFFGEEGDKVDLTNHRGYTWIIDPIDGTKSYLRKNPLFATQLALMHDGELIVGVSNAPLLKELMYAEKGAGCFVNGTPAHVSKVDSVSDAYLSFGSLKYFTKAGQAEPLLGLAQEAKWARGIGDFWSYHLLAQGKLDVMVEAETKLWDIAALSVIVREAGGSITQLDGRPIDHTATTALATNGLIHTETLSRFNS
jgi:histidinol-phosphatase